MQFQVPQFVETESKIFWVFTIGQFFYAAATVLVSILLFDILSIAVWAPITIILIGSSVVIAVHKINGRPITAFVLAAFSYFWGDRYFSSKVQAIRPSPITAEIKPASPQKTPLKNLFRLLTTSTNPVPKRETPFGPEFSRQQAVAKERYEILRKITGEKEVARRIDYR
jgi:hypothetical protein